MSKHILHADDAQISALSALLGCALGTQSIKSVLGTHLEAVLAGLGGLLRR
jgi:hypothetical protein